MKLFLELKVPGTYQKSVIAQIVREIQGAVNLLAEEKLAAHYGATTAAPTTGTWAKGDRVRNSAPSEAGSSPNKYVILGWVCVDSGTPGTWKEMRALTGN